MKRTLKKVLLVTSVIMMAMLMLTFVSSAVIEDCGMGNHVLATRVILPTCTEEGYTETYCTICESGKNGLGTSDYVPALGHDYAQWGYTKDGDHFIYGSDCARENCNSFTTDEKIYYSVKFLNPWSTKTYCEDVTYVNLAYDYETVELGSLYVEAGNAVIEGPEASREKDKTFGRYYHDGFTTAAVNSGEFTQADLFVFGEDGTKINANTELFAAFTGEPEVYYQVQFYNTNGVALTRMISARHGQKVDDEIFQPVGIDEDGDVIYANAPQMQETSAYYFTFDKWNIDINHLYGPTAIMATYDNHHKMYEYIYCDYNGTPLTIRDSQGNLIADSVRDTIGYGMPAEYNLYLDGVNVGDLKSGVMVDGKLLKIAEAIERPKDRTYIYFWQNMWKHKDGYYEVGASSMTTPESTLDTRYKDQEEYAPIYLVPKYTTRLVQYTFDLTAIIPATESNPDYYLDKIIVQIQNDKGQWIGGGRTVAVDGKAVFSCILNDSQYYNITAVTEDEKYTAQKTLDRAFIYDPTFTTINTTINLQLNPDYVEGNRCSCIHHNALFRPLWVRILNLLYNLFNVKYVCCDDMYATLGDVLAYTK